MTALSQILAGARLAASAVQGIAPVPGYKGIDEPVTSSAALQNDDALFLPVAANATYLWVCYLSYEGGTQGSSDMKFQFTGPSGATASYTFIYYPTSGGVGANTNISRATGLSSVVTAGTDGAGVKLGLIMIGTLVTSSTPGSLRMQWAQNTSSGTATIVHAGSILAAWQVG